MKRNHSANYSSKLIERAEVLSLLQPNDRILTYGGSTSFLSLLDEHYKELTNLELYTIFLLTKDYGFLRRPGDGHIRHMATFVSPPVRAALEDGFAPEILLTHYSDTDDFVRIRARPSVLFTQVTPLDENGYFTMGFNSLGHRVAADIADRVIVQVNHNLPYIYGECNKLHINEVTAIYEEDTPLYTAVPELNDEIAMQAASFVAERIPNGATLQIGVGRVPDAVTAQLMAHKDLGVHTEMFSRGLMELMKAGIINNSKKTVLPGKSIFSFSGGTRATQEIYDFVDRNPDLEMRPISWVNDPRVIALLDNFISINSALMVDLTGQVCSETLGLRTFSGPGGQLDFIRGARWSNGGKSFILIDSVAKSKDGTKTSKINISLAPGSAVTAPRADVDCIVTEYGVAELRFRSIAERAKAMIAIAHPDYRDELTFKARKAGYFI